ncbi:hypothetical protein EMF73_37150, partial [Klebsiella pneumoniae]
SSSSTGTGWRVSGSSTSPPRSPPIDDASSSSMKARSTRPRAGHDRGPHLVLRPSLRAPGCSKSSAPGAHHGEERRGGVMLVHQAFRFELDPNDRSRSALASHAGASRFAYDWGLALVKARLEQREQIRRAGYRELLPDDEVERLARTVEVPWTLPSLRKAWNLQKAEVAPWWS